VIRCKWKFREGASRLFVWGAVLIAILWALQPFFLRTRHHGGVNLSAWGKAPELVVLSVLVVSGGLLFWWILDRLFWRKYFPTQDSPKPPEKRDVYK
jgi:hypothetical protein